MMSTHSTAFRIIRAGLDRLHEIEPLWKALQDHHGAISRELGETRRPHESWERRRTNYEGWLKLDGSFLLLAEIDDTVVAGYAFVRRAEASEMWERDQVAELETLSVLPSYRSTGVGRGLMESVFSELKEQGISNISLQVLASNDRGIEFYERLGFKTAFVHMFKNDL